MLTAQLRQKFLEFFKKEGHHVVPSSSLIPKADPSLLFTNAGMVPFKNFFTGAQRAPYATAASAQKCVRAGGKHNDLENVGYTARHHTFFEMLGNFSFGDYFKEHAIELAWRFLTQELGIDKNRLYITHYHEDLETRALWKSIANIPEDHLISISTNDNFWSMGETGPCGPCSEIFYDHGPEIWGGLPGTPEQDGDRFVEIWNLVFMQYEQVSADKRIALPKPAIDTGMGLERLAAVMQNTYDNYETDILRALIEASAALTKTDPDGPHRISHRVIADHLRSSCFLMADGVLPSNEGRGYVLRRIMRRAMRHVHLLGAKELILGQLVPTLISKMGEAYPELYQAQTLMQETLLQEERGFQETLGRGLKLLFTAKDALKPGEAFPGSVAFKLYDTYGFPLDLTEDVLRGENIVVDTEGFHQEMGKQKTQARASWSGSGEKADDKIWLTLKDRLPETKFLGYEQETSSSRVVALVKNAGEVKTLHPGEEALVLLDQTPFYAESGGQVGDRGLLLTPGVEVQVLDTIKMGDIFHGHIVKVLTGTLSVEDEVTAKVQGQRRSALRAHHSATHLLHGALKDLLGPAVAQRGSLVAPDRLRFDFCFPRALTPEEVRHVEQRVNAEIRKNQAVVTHVMPLEEALDHGALGLFGEKYKEDVRVVRIGEEEMPASMELCGGTHVRAAGDIGYFKITSEAGVSAGIRRIEAVAGLAAEQWGTTQENLLREASLLLKTTPADLDKKIRGLLDQRKALEKEISHLKQGGSGATTGDAAKNIHGISFVSRTLQGVGIGDLRGIVDGLKQKPGPLVVLLFSIEDHKITALLGVSEDLAVQHPATDLIQLVAPFLGAAKGGGKATLAQCGGKDLDKIPLAIKAVEEALQP